MATRAALESLLRARKLDITLTTANPWRDGSEQAVASTGVAELDRQLGGGIRRGHLSEIVGPHSSGRTSLLCRMLAAATSRGEVVALIDAADRFDPASAAAAGVDLARLLWVRERGEAPRALKALNLVLQAGGFGLVAFDIADLPARTIRQFPYTTWLRLARVIEGSQTVVVLVGADRFARSPGGVTIALGGGSGSRYARWQGSADRARWLRAIEVTPRVVSSTDCRTASAEVRP